MSAVWRDSFDWYASAQTTVRYPTVSNNGSISSTHARTGSQGIKASNTGSIGYIRRNVAVAEEHATFIQGVAMRRIDASSQGMLQFCSDAGATVHVTIITGTDGSIQVRRGTNTGTILAQTAIDVFPADNAFHYLEAKVTLSDTVGAVTVQMDGVVVAALTLTNADTKNAGTKTVFDSHGIGGAGNCSLDDYYVANGAGTVNNDFYGDTEVLTLYPTAAGNSTGFTPSTGANYTTVDEAQLNTTDYVTGTADGTTDLYGFGDLSNTTGIIRSVTEHVYAAKVGTEVKYVRTITRVGGTNYEGASQLLSTSYQHFRETRELNPNTSAAWTVAGVNGAEWGVVAKDT